MLIPVADESPDTAADAPAPKKRKRVQLSSCDACRLRRVRCVRPSVQERCEACIKRDLECTGDFIESKAGKLRSGRLAEQAKLLYGKDNGESTSDSSTPETAPLLSVSPQALISTSPRTPEHVMASRQQAESVAASLIQCYHTYLSSWEPPADIFADFLGRFEAAGRRPSQLAPHDQILCDVAMAAAARISSLPLILGTSAPDLEDVRHLTDGELTQWGKRREAFCRGLETRARKHTEQRAMTSSPTVESIACLLMAQKLDDSGHPDQDIPRAFSAIAVEQLRSMAVKRDKTEVELRALDHMTGIVRPVIITDAMSVFNRNKPLQVSDADLAILYPRLLLLRPEEALDIAPFIRLDEPLNPQISALADHLTHAARDIHQRLTGPIAQLIGAPAASTFHELHANLELYLGVCDAVDAALVSSYPHALIAAATVRYGFAMLMVVLREVADGSVAKARTEEHRLELEVARDMLNEPFARAMRQAANVAKQTLLAGQMVGQNLLWAAAPAIAEMLFVIPPAEMGGPPDWPLATKIDDIDWMIKVIKHLGWSSARSAEAAPELERKLVELRCLVSASLSAPEITGEPTPSTAQPPAAGTSAASSPLLPGPADYDALFSDPDFSLLQPGAVPTLPVDTSFEQLVQDLLNGAAAMPPLEDLFPHASSTASASGVLGVADEMDDDAWRALLPL